MADQAAAADRLQPHLLDRHHPPEQRRQVCFIAKSEISGWPIFGWLARLQRTFFIERDKPGKSGEQASELARRLAAGDVMVLFAEGSTSDGNLILPFKSTLFGAASAAIREGVAEKVHIQPVAITYMRVHGMPMGRQHRPLAAWIGDSDLVPHLGAILREGAMDVDIRFGEPIEFNAASDRKAVTRRDGGPRSQDGGDRAARYPPAADAGQVNRLFFASEKG